MTHTTEAACLLASGAIYGRRALLVPAAGDPVFAGFKAGAFSLYYGDAPIYHFDLEGRWQRAFIDGVHYLKGFDSTVQSIDRVREGENLVLKRRTLSYAETSDLDALMRDAALGLIENLNAGRYETQAPPSKGAPLPTDDLLEFLERVSRWDAAAWFAHRDTYLGTYGPMPLLPPDCLTALVLQATLGHRTPKAFGNAPGSEYYARNPAEFDAHAGVVAGLMGRRAAQCRNVFLAGSDVLSRPPDDVAAYLGTVSRRFPVRPAAGPRRPDTSGAPHWLDGVHSFLDEFQSHLPDADVLTRWRALGLTRVTLGVESGDESVRSRFGKAWSNADLVATVANLKAAGIGVGLIVLAGAGGASTSAGHVAATTDLVLGLGLSAGDLVSLVDARELEDGTAGDRPSNAALAAEVDEFKAGLAPLRAAKVKVAPYSLEKQGSF